MFGNGFNRMSALNKMIRVTNIICVVYTILEQNYSKRSKKHEKK